MKLDNPFQFEAANSLSNDEIADYYIDDFNYSRFIQSKRNVFVVGERGSGKTMALLYNRWELQKLRAEREGTAIDYSTIGVYVPCNTPLIHKPEYRLLDGFLGSVLGEHLLVLAVAHSLAEVVGTIGRPLNFNDIPAPFHEASALFGVDLNLLRNMSFFDSVRTFIQGEIRQTQLAINSPNREAFYENTFSFVSLLAPLLDLCSQHVKELESSHFSIMIDDAHSLNEYQMKALNSWIAYRDHTRFSFKVAVAKSGRVSKVTSSGGEILERHDYTTVDLEAPLHNRRTGYYEMAKLVVERRLQRVGVEVGPEAFFPPSKAMKRDLLRSKEIVAEQAEQKFGTKTSKAAQDYIYKQARAHYFRTRPPKAGTPPYSGFDMLVFLSTGVIRNLLEPCFWMFDRVLSDMDGLSTANIGSVSPDVQSEVIRTSSERLWAWLRDDLARDIEGCSAEDGSRAHQMLEALANFFHDRLQSGGAEPNATSFTLSGTNSVNSPHLEHVLDVLRRAQLIYVRNGPAKDKGKVERYFVPNRMLWPVQKLDPHGQHARVSISVDDLWNATETGKLPQRTMGANDGGSEQEELFDED